MSRIKWVAEVACEYGGPVIIADAPDYEKWMGATPYPLEWRRVLHYWGQLTSELPPPFQDEEGHVFRTYDSFEELLAERDALVAAIEASFDGAKVTVNDSAGEAHVALPDDRQMRIELGPKSQYEEACEGDVIWEHEYHTPTGRRGHAVFWDKEGSGNFYVGVTEKRDELVLLRTWVDDAKFEDLAKAHVEDRPESEEDAASVRLEIADGKTFIAYSPHGWVGILGKEKLDSIIAEINAAGLSREQGSEKLLDAFRALTAEAASTTPVMLSTDENADIAAVLSLVPGAYEVSFGHFDPDEDDSSDEDGEREDSWSCIWCRFKRSTS